MGPQDFLDVLAAKAAVETPDHPVHPVWLDLR